MDTCFILILIVGTGLVTGDNIEPDKEREKNTKETETVKMSCSYSTNSEYVLLYWYRQYPNKEPQYLLRKEARSESSVYAHTSERRFQSTTSRTSTELTITDVRLSDSALYYCALRVVFGLGYTDPLTFGDPIRLTVEPKDVPDTPPVLSILSPLDDKGQDICLAAGFFPRDKTMILTPDGKELKTNNNAALFISSKTYYYAGFNGDKIQKCKVDEVEADPTADVITVTEKPKGPVALSCPTKDTNAPASEFLNSDKPKMNSMTLLVTGLRILLAKCVAVNVLMSVKAFLF